MSSSDFKRDAALDIVSKINDRADELPLAKRIRAKVALGFISFGVLLAPPQLVDAASDAVTQAVIDAALPDFSGGDSSDR